ncbi:MAG TPA: alpha-L-arabinofuranosidase [Opitutus sp.]|nr:alpha-L-arabinofuranosidase [Opitutus sp.]
MKTPSLRPSALAALLISFFLRTSASAQTDLAIYDDSLVNGWQNWSWAATDTASTAAVHSGANAIAVTASAWSALYLHHDPIDTHGYENFVFWINGGPTGGQFLRVSALLGDSAQPSTVTVGPLAASVWQQIIIPLSALGAAGQTNLTGLWIQENTGTDQPTFYVDDLVLTAAPPPATVHVTIDARHVLRRVDPRLFGVNAAVWDSAFGTDTTRHLLLEAGNQVLRFPGGSISDGYHWATNTSDANTWQWATSFDTFAPIARATHAQVFITVNYGTGTPEEAAAWVAHSNREQHNGFRYWEIGNENYGTWEEDNNTRPHDPVTYATRFKDYYTQMKAVDPRIRIGAVVTTGEDSDANYADESVTNPRTGAAHSGWTPVLLATFKSLGITPDFVIYHRYAQAPFGENDSYLLTSSASWADDAANLRQMLNDYLGAAAAHVELTCTENNSVYSNPGKQTTSLVNGLFLADSTGQLLKTEFNSLVWWDLRNGQESGNNNSPALYGWRPYGDYGIVDSADPATAADRYPTFYVKKLLQHYARGGERVLDAVSDYIGLGAYAVRSGDDSVHVLLINKHPTAALNVAVSVSGLPVGHVARFYRYSIPQDEAARTGTGSADIEQGRVRIAGSNFTYAPGPYSATILQLGGD